jgi:ComEC/Rec2-related protein
MNLSEQLRQIPYVRLTLALFAGIVWQVWAGGFAFPALFVALGLALGYVVLNRIPFFKTRAREWVLGPVALLCLFFVGVALVQQQKTQTILPLDRDIWLQAEVCDNPICTDRYTKVEAIVKRYVTEDDTATVREKVILYLSLDESLPVPIAGAALYAHATLSHIPPPGNPDEFNYRQYLARRKIFASAFVQQGCYSIDNNLSFWKTVQYTPLHWQRWGLETFADSPLGDKEYGVLVALTLGNKQWIDEDLRKAYVAAGAMHVLAVSGLHVGIIMVLLNFMTSFLNRRRHGRLLKNILMMLALWVYAAIVGFSPSVTRSVVMITVHMYAQTAGRKNDGLNSLCFAATVVLLSNPFFLIDLGFLLSFTAVLGLILFSRTFGKAFGAVENRVMPKIIKGYLETDNNDFKSIADNRQTDKNTIDININSIADNRQADGNAKNISDVPQNGKPKRPLSVKIAKKLAALVKDSLAMTLSANIGVFPVLRIYFGGIPLISLVANIFVVPAVSILFPYLLVVSVLGAVAPFLNVFLLPAEFFIDAINESVYFFSQSPFFITDGIFGFWTSLFGENSLFWFAMTYYTFLIYISKIYIGPKLNLKDRIFKRRKEKL